MAALLALTGAELIFSNCRFHNCGIMATAGASIALRECFFYGGDVAVCAWGAATSVTLEDCSLQACSEGFALEGGASLTAVRCQLHNCKINGMHAAGRASLSVQDTVVEGCLGHAGWARGAGTSVTLASCVFKRCVRGSFCVDQGAQLSTVRSREALH